MDKLLNSKLKMYQRVLVVLNDNETVWNDKVAYVNAWSSLSQNYQALKLHTSLMYQPTIGLSIKKNAKREILMKKMHSTFGLLEAHAIAISDEALRSRYQLNLGSLQPMREADLELLGERLLTDVANFSTALEDYGFNATKVQALETSYQEWLALVKAPREAINRRKSEAFEVKQLVQSCNNLLRDTMDKLMLSFKEVEPVFYFNYKMARKVFHTRGRNDNIDLGKPSNTD